MTTSPPRPLVEGPSAWIGRDLRSREDEWIYPLSPNDVAELETAIAAVRVRGLDIADIKRADFPLPTLGPKLDRLREEILEGRYISATGLGKGIIGTKRLMDEFEIETTMRGTGAV